MVSYHTDRTDILYRHVIIRLVLTLVTCNDTVWVIHMQIVIETLKDLKNDSDIVTSLENISIPSLIISYSKASYIFPVSACNNKIG